MAFINEYVSEEDIQKYQLREIWLQHHPAYKKDKNPFSTFRFKWAIDRERDTYLMCISGGGYDRDYSEWVLFWRNQPVTIHLKMPGEGSKSFEQPYRIVWALDRIYKQLVGAEQQEFLHALKEALTVYGYDGIRKQIPNTVVSFKF